MVKFDVILQKSAFSGVKDYERIINRILKHDVVFSVLKFNLTENGIEMKLEVPKDKIDVIREEFQKESVKIGNQIIEIDEDLCIDCGQCISLCNTGALYFDENYKRAFCEDKCVGCQLCIDACPRKAISFK